jgi:hypothetical protein
MVPRIYAEAAHAATYNNSAYGAQLSCRNYDAPGVDNIWLTDKLRCLITDEKIPLWSDYDNDIPHAHNTNVLLRNRFRTLTVIPLEGHQENIKYVVTLPGTSDTELYQRYKLTASSYELVGPVYLQRSSWSTNKTLTMRPDEINRVCWKGPIYTLLYEHQDPEVGLHNYLDTYVLGDDSPVPSVTGLYTPMSSKHYRNRLAEIQQYLPLRSML